MRSKRDNKSSHKGKPTYVERVLGAMSLIQKGRKQRMIHLATLRAQVRKTAIVRKDRLGPQWSSHVGKAVQKLEAYGILQHAETSGTVSLTPDAKRAAALAQRELKISHPTTSGQDAIWKTVCTDFTSSKRRRTYDEPDATPTKKSKTLTAKPKALSRMTKAELLAELRSLKRSEPDHGSDELQRSRNDIKSRELQIERTRAELEQARKETVSSSLESVTSSPRVTSEPPLPSPSDTQRSRIQTDPSLSSASKSPISEPSEPYDDDFMFAPDTDEDVFQSTPTRGAFFTPQTSSYISMPDKTPQALPTRNRELTFERPKSQASRDRAVTMETDLEPQLNLRTLSSYEAEIKDLKKIIEEHQVRYTELQASGTDIAVAADMERQQLEDSHTTQMQSLQAEIDAIALQLHEDLHLLSAEIKTREVSITQLSAAKAMAQNETKASKETETALRIQLRETSEKLRETQSDLDVISDLRVSLADQLRLSAEQRLSLASDLEQSYITVLGLQEVVAEKEERIQRMLTDYDALNTSFVQQETGVHNLQVAIRTEQEVASRLQTESVAERARASTLQAQLDARDRVVGELQSKYEAAEEKNVQREEQLAHLKSIISELELTVNAMQMEQTNVAQLTDELEKAKVYEVELCGRVSTLEISNCSMSSALEAGTHELAEVRGQLLSAQEIEQSTSALLTQAREAAILSGTAHESKISGLKLMLDSANKEVRDLQKRLDSAEATSKANICNLNQEIASLSSLLESERGYTADAKDALATLDATLEAEKGDHQIRAASLLSSLSIAQNKIGELQAASGSTKHAYESAIQVHESRTSSLQHAISTLTTRIRDMQDVSERIQARVAELEKALDLAQGRASLLGSELEKSHATSDESQRKIGDLAKAASLDQETIEKLVTGYARLRQAQMACFSEMDSAVVSASYRSAPTEGGLATESELG